MKRSILLGILVFLLVVNIAQAEIWSSDSTGQEKNIFYSNETVYITSSNITNTSIEVRIYIVNDNNAWSNNTALSDVSGGYKLIATNASGYIQTTAIWTSPSVGKYDIVVDVNKDGIYNDNVDFIDNSTIAGFEVLAVPVPTLNVAKGISSPADHTWDLQVNGSGFNTMLQINLKAEIEDIRVNSIALAASGSGDDSNGISVVRFILDENNNSKYELGEKLLAYGKYLRDNGMLMLSIENGYLIPVNTSVNMIVVYTMTNSSLNGSTFSFQVVYLSAVGLSGNQALVNGLPINSAVKTIVAPVSPPQLKDECNVSSDCGIDYCSNKTKILSSCEYNSTLKIKTCNKIEIKVDCCIASDCQANYYCSNNSCIKMEEEMKEVEKEKGFDYRIIFGVIAMTIAIVIVFLFFMSTTKSYEFEKLKEKWKR